MRTDIGRTVQRQAIDREFVDFFPAGADRFLGEALTVAARGPTMAQEISFLNGLTPGGTITDESYWGNNGSTAYKWGNGALGTGATITYAFQSASKFKPGEKATFEKAFAIWSAVANLTFVETTDASEADVLLRRGKDGGAYNSTPSSNGSGTTLGVVTGQALISIDTRTPGFDLSGSFTKFGGYGLSTVIHEIGHLLGLGHGGDYNGAVNPRTQQYSAYDDLMYTIMSYISWEDDGAKFAGRNPVQGTDWGTDAEGFGRTSPHTAMMLDIAAIQQLYGTPVSTPFDGGEVYGFDTNIAGPAASFFDFTINTAPIVTIYNQGVGNTLDLSGYAMDQVIDLAPGSFSSIGGLTNNVAIAPGTVIETAIGGSGNDTIFASDVASRLSGGAGADSLHGGAAQDRLTGDAGADVFWFDAAADTSKKANRADVILDFDGASGDRIDLSAIDAIKGGADHAFTFIGSATFNGVAGELRFVLQDGFALVTGDVNGDGKADFAIRVNDVETLVLTDFTL